MWWLLAAAIAAPAILYTVLVLLVIPYLRLTVRCRQSRKIRPQPEQLWVQDGELLYIDAVTQYGVEIIHWEPGAKGVNKWKDSWSQWEERGRKRALWYTGERRPLGEA